MSSGSADPRATHAPDETSYEVNGFRSLAEFSISLSRGLNVLVGPNGSGKTNFIEFLDFLSNLISSGVSNAVSSSGGVARVFSQEQSKRQSSKITATVRGIADIGFVREINHELSVFNFEYEIEIKFSRVQSVVFISREAIRFKRLRHVDDHALCSSSVGGILLQRQAANLDGPPRIEVGARLRTKNRRNPLHLRSRYLAIGRDKVASDAEVMDVSPDESLLSLRHIGPAIDAIRLSITRGRSFNLVPEKARAPDDLTRGPSISQDGSGLTSTLYHMQQATAPVTRRPRASRVLRARRFLPEYFETLVEWTKLVFSELEGIETIADPHTGKYLGYLLIGKDGLKIPLQAASDGTLKWLALVALIITRGGVYSIEEPENFLHPRMQQYLIDLIRDFSLDRQSSEYFIVSTHSETLVNKCSPSELIMFEFRDGRTVCSRLKNQSSVQEQINKTGFGLGYYYASNAIS